MYKLTLIHMSSHLCRAKHVRKASILLDAQKEDGDDCSDVRSSTLNGFFSRICLNCARSNCANFFYIALGTLS